MKKIILPVLLFVFGATLLAQDLPRNPESGKCYVISKTTKKYKDVSVKVEISPSHKTFIVHPAEYKTVPKLVLVESATKRFEIVPAVWETEEVSYLAKKTSRELNLLEATFQDTVKVIEKKPTSSVWRMGTKSNDCVETETNDCNYWFYKTTSAEIENVPIKTLISKAKTVVVKIPAQSKTYTKRRLITPTKVKTIRIPAIYDTINKLVLVKKAWKEQITVDAKYKTITKKVLVKKDDLKIWKEVDCNLVNNTPLLISWALGSSVLSDASKKIIKTKLLPLLKIGFSIAIESHTDSRGTEANNQLLSNKRAKAVTDYLASLGINPSLLSSEGFGESKLINDCSDKATCSDKKHRENRRTTFRVVNQK